LSFPLITQDDQHGDFRSNENIYTFFKAQELVLVSIHCRHEDQSDVSSVSSFADLKDERRLSGTYAADIALPTQTF